MFIGIPLPIRIQLLCVQGWCKGLLYTYRRGLSALLVQQYRAMREASKGGTGDRTVPTLSFYAVTGISVIKPIRELRLIKRYGRLLWISFKLIVANMWE